MQRRETQTAQGAARSPRASTIHLEMGPFPRGLFPVLSVKGLGRPGAVQPSSGPPGARSPWTPGWVPGAGWWLALPLTLSPSCRKLTGSRSMGVGAAESFIDSLIHRFLHSESQQADSRPQTGPWSYTPAREVDREGHNKQPFLKPPPAAPHSPPSRAVPAVRAVSSPESGNLGDACGGGRVGRRTFQRVLLKPKVER